MIKEISKNDIEQCVNVIRKSFSTVASEFGFTEENAPRFTAFSTTKERLDWRKWYESHGFIHIGTKKFDFFPFTCGYMVKEL